MPINKKADRKGIIKNVSIERISEEDQENHPIANKESLQYVLVDEGKEILPQRRKLKFNEINKAGLPVYQLE